MEARSNAVGADEIKPPLVSPFIGQALTEVRIDGETRPIWSFNESNLNMLPVKAGVYWVVLVMPHYIKIIYIGKHQESLQLRVKSHAASIDASWNLDLGWFRFGYTEVDKSNVCGEEQRLIMENRPLWNAEQQLISGFGCGQNDGKPGGNRCNIVGTWDMLHYGRLSRKGQQGFSKRNKTKPLHDYCNFESLLQKLQRECNVPPIYDPEREEYLFRHARRYHQKVVAEVAKHPSEAIKNKRLRVVVEQQESEIEQQGAEIEQQGAEIKRLKRTVTQLLWDAGGSRGGVTLA